MFGIPDPGIWMGYLLSVLSLILCIVYGAWNWNNGSEPAQEDPAADLEWEQMEEEIKELL